jgi:hypothetical protein
MMHLPWPVLPADSEALASIYLAALAKWAVLLLAIGLVEKRKDGNGRSDSPERVATAPLKSEVHPTIESVALK